MFIATFQVADLTQHLVKGLGRTGKNGRDKSSRNKKRRDDKRPRNGANRWALRNQSIIFIRKVKMKSILSRIWHPIQMMILARIDICFY